MRGAARGATKIIAAQEGRVDPDIALGLRAGAEDDIAARPSHHDAEEEHDHDDFDSFVVDVPALADPDAFVEKLAEVAAPPRRAARQGFPRRRRQADAAAGAGRRRALPPRVRPAVAAGRAAARPLVVIGRKGLDRAAIEAALALMHLLRTELQFAGRDGAGRRSRADARRHRRALVHRQRSRGAGEAWERLRRDAGLGAGVLRLASLADLRHPYSVDLYVEKVVAHARFVLIRLLGGLDYWRYGVDEIARLPREAARAWRSLPGDARDDRASTPPRPCRRPSSQRLAAYLRQRRRRQCRRGAALHAAAPSAARFASPSLRRKRRSASFAKRRGAGAAARADRVLPLGLARRRHGASRRLPTRSHARRLRRRGGLRDEPEGPRRRRAAARASGATPPDVILNATAFSARLDDGDDGVRRLRRAGAAMRRQPGDARRNGRPRRAGSRPPTSR